MLRWLTTDVPNRVVVSMPTDQVNPRNPIAIRAAVVDSIFIARNDAKVVAHLTSDDGTTRDLPLDWAIDRDGEYRGTFTPDKPGVYTVRVDASIPNGGVGGRHGLRARRRSQHRVLRRRDARAAAQADGERDGRQVLHAGDGGHAGRRRGAEQARRDGRESDGSVGHAGDLPAARRARDARSGRTGRRGGWHEREAGSGSGVAGRVDASRSGPGAFRRASRFPLPPWFFTLSLQPTSSSSAVWAAKRSTRDSFKTIASALADAAKTRVRRCQTPRFCGSAKTASRSRRTIAGSRRRSTSSARSAQLASRAGAGDQVVIVLDRARERRRR